MNLKIRCGITRCLSVLSFLSLLPLVPSQESYGYCDKGTAAHTEIGNDDTSSANSDSQPETDANSFGIGGTIIENPTIARRYYEFPQEPQLEQTVNYFKNLHTNLPLNNVGNCAYVAASSLLGYYDAYRSDYFIDEKYDKTVSYGTLEDSTYSSSPCVVDYPIKYFSSFSSYLDGMISNGSFVGYLYSLALDKGYLTRTQDSAGMWFKDFGNFLTYYISLQSDKLQSKAPSSILTPVYVNHDPVEIIQRQYTGGELSPALDIKECVSSKKEFRNQLIARLKQGKPEVVAGNNHFCIAYYYDSDSDIIYGNRGWKNNSRANNVFVNLDQYFEAEPMYYWYGIELNNYGHTHSNNYIVSSGEQSLGRCGCELKSHVCPNVDYVSSCYCCCPNSHSKHVTQSASYHDQNFHLSTCSCGRQFFEDHVKDDFGFCKYCHQKIKEDE